MNVKNGQWLITQTKTVYKNSWIKVKEDSVFRDGKKGTFSIVEMKHGVSVLPFDNKGFVYLVKEYKYAVKRETIEAISGGIENNEDKLSAAKRELKEEAGIIAEDWIDLGVIDPFTNVILSPNYMFLAKKLRFSKANPEDTENIKIIKISFKKVVQWVIKNKITHGATVAVILKTKNYLKI